jgi:hypothetical protein
MRQSHPGRCEIAAPIAPMIRWPEDCRAWGFDNLYVTDFGCSCRRQAANPTLTPFEANCSASLTFSASRI